MKVLPAVDMMRGEPPLGGARVPPEEAPDVARRWVAEGARGLHVVDLDGAMGRGGNRSALQRLLSSASVEVQVGGGVRSEEDLAALISWGASRVMVATRAAEEPAWLEAVANAFPGRVMVSLDVAGGRMMTHGWTRGATADPMDLLKSTQALPLGGVLYTDLGVEGRRAGVRDALVREVLGGSSHPVYVAGGVASVADLELLKDLGAAGAILGSALYAGDLKLREALGVEGP